MRILMLGWELPPHNSGGLGVASFHMSRAIAEAGADIDFIVPYIDKHHEIKFMNVISAVPANADEVISESGAYESWVYRDHATQLDLVDKQDFHRIYEKAIPDIVKLADYDVIHAFDWLTIRPALIAKQLTGLPLIVNIHALEYDRAAGAHGNPFVREIEYQGMMMADKVVAVSEHTKNIIIDQYHIPSEKVEVIHNYLNIGDIPVLTAMNSYPYLTKMRQDGYKVLLNFGRLTMQKGMTNLIHTFKKVHEMYPKSLLLIIGSGDQEQELIRLAADIGVGANVIFAGFQRGKKWRDCFEVSDAFAMPSISEPFGLTALEAAACGVPTVISRQSGVAEILKTSLKADYWDMDELANKIVGIFENEGLSKQLIQDSKREIATLSWSKNAEKFMNLYRQQAGALS